MCDEQLPTASFAVAEREGIVIKLASWNLTHDRLPLRLLITGLPGSGKTALLKKLKLDLASAGVVRSP